MVFLSVAYLICEWIFGPVPIELKMVDCNLGWFYERKIFYFSHIESLNGYTVVPLLFLENSHFGMIATPIIIFLTLYTFKKENLNYKSFTVYLITFSVFAFVISTTYLACITFISLLVFLISKTNLLQKTALIFLFFYGIYSISVNYQCNIRFYDTAWVVKNKVVNYAKNYLSEKGSLKSSIDVPSLKNYLSEKGSLKSSIDVPLVSSIDVPLVKNYTKKVLQDDKAQPPQKTTNTKLLELVTTIDNLSENLFENIKIMSSKDEKEKNIIRNDNPLNLSSEVFLNSTDVMTASISKNVYGYGFNNYEDAFAENKKVKNYRNIVGYLNKKDASGNLMKMLVEYGIFFLLFLLLIIKYYRLENISIENKMFFLSVILTQLLRGAGYFNGGFILATSVILVSVIQKKKTIKQ